MYLSLLFTLVVATWSVEVVSDTDFELTTIYESGSFDKELVEPRLLKGTMYFAFNPAKCAKSFVLSVSEDTLASVQVIEGHQNGVYKWGTIGSATIHAGENIVAVEEGPVCAARFRITIEQGSFESVAADVTEDALKKRINCPGSASDNWPKECKSATEGPRCITGAICGCLEDADCYSDTTHPFCDTTTRSCVKCTDLPVNPVQRGYACRSRYPSRYYVDEALATKTQSPGQAQIAFTNSEQIPNPDPNEGGFFKEICVTGGGTTGGCDRCDQANAVNTPDLNLTWPVYTGPSEFISALTGSFFCGQVRGDTSPTPTRPLCIMAGLFDNIGMTSTWKNLTVSLEIANYGTYVGGPNPPLTDQTIEVTLDLWQGTCAPCSVLDATNNAVRIHSACLSVLSTEPICDANPTVGCRGCTTNADCGLATSNCTADGTGSCTGGNNCQANGSCRTCTSDADCGALDGGEMGGQMKCDLPTGICIDLVPCSDNFGTAGATVPCEDAAAPNCQKSGLCIFCTSNADCGVLDGGDSGSDEMVCFPDGVCRDCDSNNGAGLTASCPAATFPNCNKDGTCISCLSNANCGTTDGGETPDQVLCLPDGVCSACDDNNGGTAGMVACPTAALPNCNKNGLCIRCTNMATCGATDGGQLTDQSVCDVPSGICIGSCDDNFGAPDGGSAPCTLDTASNCNKDGACIQCLTNADCGSTDGGQVLDQPLCLPSLGVCSACTDNNGVGTATSCPANALPNCNKNGLCIRCATDADCGSSDGGSVPDQSVCDVATGICIAACTDNFGVAGTNPCPLGSLPNCDADGHCRLCTMNSNCGVTDGGSRPGQTICNVVLGVCINPCTVNFGVVGVTPCETAAFPNCNVDGTCIKCATNTNCGLTDGGNQPGQQVCNIANGICVACTVNADCVGTTGANCQANGRCVDCTTDPANLCTATADGGQPASGPCTPTGTGYCPDMNGQTICNNATDLCESPCLGNGWCADKRAAGIVGYNDGANCQLDGTCVSCQPPLAPGAVIIADAPLCGKLDGPLLTLVGAKGKALQSECQITGVCSDPVGPPKRFTPGPPSLLFGTNLNDPSNPLLAKIEYDRQNNIKGTVMPVNGTANGQNPPFVVNATLVFPVADYPCDPATGGGQVTWGPFRLDHNTVWNDGALPVEDNVWVFSWRLRVTQDLNVAASCPFWDGNAADPAFNLLFSPWYVLYSFPAADNPQSNMAVAMRSRPEADEIAVFIGEDVSAVQSLPRTDYVTKLPSPVVAWQLTERVTATHRLATSYIVSIPHPDRVTSPTLEVSFRASPGDFTSVATYSDIAAWLDNVVNGAVTLYAATLDGAADSAALFALNVTRTAFSYPLGFGVVGNFSATYTVEDNFQNSIVWRGMSTAAGFIELELTVPTPADVLNSAQTTGSNVIHFNGIHVNYRYPGAIPLASSTLWVDGVKQPVADSSFEPALYVDTESFTLDWDDLVTSLTWTDIFPGISSQSSSVDNYRWAFVISDTADETRLDYELCAAGGLFDDATEAIDAFLATGFPSGLTPYFKTEYIGYGLVVTKTPQGTLGGFTGCTIDMFFYPKSVATANKDNLIYNTDKNPDAPGPFVVVGAVPTQWNRLEGFSRYLGQLRGLTLEDLAIYSAAAADTSVYTLDESFLRTQVNCGDGEIDAPEECDSRDPSCTSDCTCPLRTVPLPPMGCTVCGNGVRDWEAFDVRNQAGTEFCEYTLDANCKNDCSSCVDSTMILDATSHLCTLCGNGILDSGEACDWKIDSACATSCRVCSVGKYPTGLGGCFFCGNGLLDEGEVCDIAVDELCSSDCSDCAPGYVSDNNGGCTKCGNGVVDEGEICDTLLTSCLNCRTCDELHVPNVNGTGCTRCGNGALDAGEVCDSAYTNCNEDCSACSAGTVPAADKLGSCSLCGNGVLDRNEKCDGDANCVECRDCREPFVLVPGGRCLLCGNGLLDDGEVCDSAHSDSCESACQACLPNFEANLDPVANPTGRCFPSSCDSAPTDDNSECECK